jgi:hypothetical protein
MDALEFTGKIEQGVIRIPEGHEEYNNVQARIIVLVDPSLQPLKKKEDLRKVFRKMEKTRMFTAINDPVTWQKQLRDEWE